MYIKLLISQCSSKSPEYSLSNIRAINLLLLYQKAVPVVFFSFFSIVSCIYLSIYFKAPNNISPHIIITQQ